MFFGAVLREFRGSHVQGRVFAGGRGLEELDRTEGLAGFHEHGRPFSGARDALERFFVAGQFEFLEYAQDLPGTELFRSGANLFFLGLVVFKRNAALGFELQVFFVRVVVGEEAALDLRAGLSDQLVLATIGHLTHVVDFEVLELFLGAADVDPGFEWELVGHDIDTRDVDLFGAEADSQGLVQFVVKVLGALLGNPHQQVLHVLGPCFGLV